MSSGKLHFGLPGTPHRGPPPEPPPGTIGVVVSSAPYTFISTQSHFLMDHSFCTAIVPAAPVSQMVTAAVPSFALEHKSPFSLPLLSLQPLVISGSVTTS